MLPAGEIMRELVLALGAALIVGGVAVVVGERTRKPGDTRPKPNMKYVALNIVLGLIMASWGISSILAAR
jgi:hypothetical protein